jgi:dihydrofolate reductase
MDSNRLLADAGGIPWSLRADVAHFRDYTNNKWLLVGRHTFLEMHGWFQASHTPLVLSSACGWDPDIGRLVASVPQALAMAAAAGQEELVCCGGAQTYAAALPFADHLVVTIIENTYPPGKGAVHFPRWEPTEWHTLSKYPLPRSNPGEPVARVEEFRRSP